MKRGIRLIILLLFFPVGVLAQGPSISTAPGGITPSPGVDKSKPGNGMLDFEADVIEGKKKAPDLFLQTESQKISPDAMIFLRNNFNDFHQNDRTRRPRLTQ